MILELIRLELVYQLVEDQMILDLILEFVNCKSKTRRFWVWYVWNWFVSSKLKTGRIWIWFVWIWCVNCGMKTRRYWIWFVWIWFIASKSWLIIIKLRSDGSGIDLFGIDLSTVTQIPEDSGFGSLTLKGRPDDSGIDSFWIGLSTSKTRWFWVWFDWNWTLNDWFVWIFDHRTTFGRRWPWNFRFDS